ncbi:NAM-like protein [Phytophthora megakarya]|uniref:NAM-like protein n=1 Tax=Phytophthora megakarya TaxID=4795 RepID=A0A225VZG2_9STRA|nr:NAM-like protein [Phytophthora megakarya]
MGRGKKWSGVEDQALAAAYVALTSGGLKTGITFWERVRERFKDTRSIRALQNRWVLVSEEVKEFARLCVDLDEQEDEEKTLETAMDVFQARKGRMFEFLSCWRILRFCPKFGGTEEDRDREVATLVELEVESPAAEELAPMPPPVDTKKENLARPATGESSKPSVEDELPSPFAQQQLTSELRRKNDLQEDELAVKLFGETPESDDSQRFFNLLKRKKLLLLEQEVDELEQAQHMRRQRTI